MKTKTSETEYKYPDGAKRAVLTAAPVLVILMTAFTGAYTELTGCIASAVLCAALFFALIGKNGPALPAGRVLTRTGAVRLVGLAALPAGYLLTCLWAVDRGLAVFGFFKFLPMPLTALILLMLRPSDRKTLIWAVPAVGTLQMLVFVPAYFIAPLKEYFFTYGRYHGGFGYSNSFALFLLLGMIVLLFAPLYPDGREEKKSFRWVRLALCAAMLAGVLLSGSRSAMLVALPVLVIAVVKNRPLRLPLIIGAAAMIAGAGIWGAVTGNLDTFARFLNFSFSESTYFDRLLYYYDALPIILRRPFGLGYRGYQFIVPSFQTGLYSVTFVHCEYLQLILDVGVIPAFAFFAGVAASFRSKAALWRKLMLGAICLHMAIDFDLQFLPVALVIPLAAESDAEPKKTAKDRSALRIVFAACLALFFAAGAYFGAGSALEAAGKYEAALKVWPGLTMSRLAVMTSAADEKTAFAHADAVMKYNKYVPVAYDYAAKREAAKGDFDAALELKNKAISLSPLTRTEYEDKFGLLYKAIWHADETGDTEAMKRYCEEMIALPGEMTMAQDKLSTLGGSISETPDLRLGEEETEYIRQLASAMGK